MTVNLSQSVTQEGQIGPREEILTKLNVRITWRTLQSRSSHCSMLEDHRVLGVIKVCTNLIEALKNVSQMSH